MPWLLASPGHQQPWYWLCRIDRSLSYSRRNVNYLCLLSVEEWKKCKYMFMFPLKNLAHKGLSIFETVPWWLCLHTCIWAITHKHPNSIRTNASILTRLTNTFIDLDFTMHTSITCGIETFNRVRPELHGQHFADDICNHIPLNENISILIKI